MGDLEGVAIVFLHRYITSLTLNEVGILTSRLFRDVPPKRLGLRVIKREYGGHQLQVFRLNIYRRLRLVCLTSRVFVIKYASPFLLFIIGPVAKGSGTSGGSGSCLKGDDIALHAAGAVQ